MVLQRINNCLHKVKNYSDLITVVVHFNYLLNKRKFVIFFIFISSKSFLSKA